MGILSLFRAKQGWQQLKELTNADLRNVPTPNLTALMAYLDEMQRTKSRIVSKSPKDTERSVDIFNAVLNVSRELQSRETEGS